MFLTATDIQLVQPLSEFAVVLSVNTDVDIVGYDLFSSVEPINREFNGSLFTDPLNLGLNGDLGALVENVLVPHHGQLLLSTLTFKADSTLGLHDIVLNSSMVDSSFVDNPLNPLTIHYTVVPEPSLCILALFVTVGLRKRI